MLILGRMLGPTVFGLIGMIAVFIAISQTLVDSGFSNALIRKKLKPNLIIQLRSISIFLYQFYVILFFILAHLIFLNFINNHN